MAIYMWREGWGPSENTYGYRPLNSTTQLTDQSGNNRDLLGTAPAFGEYQGVNCAAFTGQTLSRLIPSNFPNYTLLLWNYCTNNQSTKYIASITFASKAKCNALGGGGYNINRYHPTASSTTSNSTNFNSWKRRLFVMTRNVGVFSFYVRSENYNDSVVNTDGYTGNTDQWIYFGDRYGNYNYQWSGYLSNVVLESRTRTEEEINNYYNQFKSNYGII